VFWFRIEKRTYVTPSRCELSAELRGGSPNG
jgi:hypothetical protein